MSDSHGGRPEGPGVALRSWWRRLRSSRPWELIKLLGLAVCASILCAVVLVLVAAWLGSLWWSVAAAVATAVAISWSVPALARRRRRDRTASRSLLRRPIAGPVGLLVATALVSLTWAWPGTGAVAPAAVPGATQVTLTDGTVLAVHVTRAASATQPPLVFVHGGPGVADMAHDVPALARLAVDRDVYAYDQIGTGASSRLGDPAGYTTARAVTDLEAVRTITGADRVVLLGHSWGAIVALAYASQYPDRIAALVLSAPASLPGPDGQVRLGDPTARLDGAALTRLYLRLMWPRNLLGYALTAADPQVAHAVAGDAEMDRRFARIYGNTTPALFCDPALNGQLGTGGVGYYANQIPQLHPDRPAIDRERLASLHVPVLVIKPACDYLTWQSGADYLQVFPDVRLVMLPGAGHQAYVERPDAYAELVRDFLVGRSLPLPVQDGQTIPADYRGVR